MNYNIGVFYTEKFITDRDALKRYAAYCGDSNISPYIEPRSKIGEFLDALTAKYPQIDNYEKEKTNECPWGGSFDVSEGHILMPIAISSVRQVLTAIMELAEKYGLVVVDPQVAKILCAPAGIAPELRPRSYYSKAYWPIGLAILASFLFAIYLSSYLVGGITGILAIILITLEVKARKAFRKMYVRKIDLMEQPEIKPKININIPRWVSYPATIGIIILGIIYHIGSFKIYGGLILIFLLVLEFRVFVVKKTVNNKTIKPE